MANQSLEKKVSLTFRDNNSIIPDHKCVGIFNILSGDIKLEISSSKLLPEYTLYGIFNLLAGKIDLTLKNSLLPDIVYNLEGAIDNKTGKVCLKSAIAQRTHYGIEGEFNMQKGRLDLDIKGNKLLLPDYRINGGIFNLQNGELKITAKPNLGIFPSYSLYGILDISKGDVNLTFEASHPLFPSAIFLIDGKLE